MNSDAEMLSSFPARRRIDLIADRMRSKEARALESEARLKANHSD